MNVKFKILLLAALMGVLACNKEPDDIAGSNESLPIQFGQVETRAIVENGSDIDEFSVWAAYRSVGATSQIYNSVLENQKVYRESADSDTWIYDDTKHWVFNSLFYFFAAYPYNIGFTQQEITQGDDNYVAYYMNVEADGSAETEDILTATNITDTSVQDFETVVPITFGHLLTKVNLKINQNFDIDPDFNYYVTKVTITGIKKSGTYITMPYDGSFMQVWNTENAEELTLTKEYAEPVILRNEGAADPKVILSVWDDGLMLVPQEILVGKVKVRIDYLYDVNLTDESKGTPDFIEGYLPPANDLWQSGKSITYTIAIADQSPITFSNPTISPWATPQTGGTIIIK